MKKGSDPVFDLTYNYTGEPGPLNSPRLPVCLDFWGLAEGHRTLSERGIIAGKPARSTPYFQSCERVHPIAGDRRQNHRQNGLFSGGNHDFDLAWMDCRSLKPLFGLPLLVLRRLDEIAVHRAVLESFTLD